MEKKGKMVGRIVKRNHPDGTFEFCLTDTEGNKIIGGCQSINELYQSMNDLQTCEHLIKEMEGGKK